MQKVYLGNISSDNKHVLAGILNIVKCEVCGKIIPIKITINEDEISIEIDQTEVRGGLGNKILIKNICQDCLRKIDLKGRK